MARTEIVGRRSSASRLLNVDESTLISSWEVSVREVVESDGSFVVHWRLPDRVLSERSTFSSLRFLQFELRPKAQEENGIGSAVFGIGAELPAFSSLTKTKQVLQGLKRGKLDFNYLDIKAIFQDSLSLFWTAQWQWMRKQKYWPPNAKLQMEIWVEQVPQWQNRICLSNQRDALQIPMLKLEWEKTDAEEKTFRTMVEKIDHYWKRHLAHVGLLEWNPEVLNPELRIVDSTHDLAHPAGSAMRAADALEHRTLK